MDKYKAEQEAKLKAALEMVETRTKAKFGRGHRKVGEMVCDTGVKTGWQNAHTSFVLRLNSSTGEFIAEHGDMEYVSKSRDALQAKMNLIAKVTLDLKWTRYLHVDYKTTVKSVRWGGTTNLDLNDSREDKPVLGIELSWKVVEYSDAIELPSQGLRFMKRDVDDEGEVSDTQETEDRLPSGLVVYTKARENVLKQLREALGKLDTKMVELFNDEPDAVGRRLDSLTGGELALVGAISPEKPKKPKRHPRNG